MCSTRPSAARLGSSGAAQILAKKGNIRDQATSAQLVCRSNPENLNALFISQGLSQPQRLSRLNQIAIQQMKLLATDNRLPELPGGKNGNNSHGKPRAQERWVGWGGFGHWHCFGSQPPRSALQSPLSLSLEVTDSEKLGSSALIGPNLLHAAGGWSS
jgi:hypothetical protein